MVNVEKTKSRGGLKCLFCGENIRKTVTYILLALWAVAVLFPFYWMILTSVKGYGAYNSEYIPKLYTLSPTFENCQYPSPLGTALLL